jgi:hypothetical protein
MTSSKTYNLQITEEQARALLYATDLLQRVQIGQWREIIDWLPLKKPIDYEELHADRRIIGAILSKHMIDGIDGGASSLGIGHPDLPKNNGVLYDLHCVIRRKLAVERAVEEGIIENENVSRNQMPITVDFDEPMKWGDEKLAVMERVND